MKSNLKTLILLLSFACSLQGATREEIMKCGMWMMHYHINPSPEEVPTMFIEMDRIGLFKDPSKQYPFLGFASRLFQENPEKTKIWFSNIDKYEDSSREILYWSLWLSGIDEERGIVKERGYSYPKNNYFKFDASKGAARMEEMDILRPGYLDMNWGQYMASGDREPVVRILQLLKFFEFTKSPESNQEQLKGELAQVALWSTKSNCKMIPGFKELIGKIYIEKALDQPALSYLGLLLTDVYPEKFYSKKDSEGKTQIWTKPIESNKPLHSTPEAEPLP